MGVLAGSLSSGAQRGAEHMLDKPSFALARGPCSPGALHHPGLCPDSGVCLAPPEMPGSCVASIREITLSGPGFSSPAGWVGLATAAAERNRFSWGLRRPRLGTDQHTAFGRTGHGSTQEGWGGSGRDKGRHCASQPSRLCPGLLRGRRRTQGAWTALCGDVSPITGQPG